MPWSRETSLIVIVSIIAMISGYYVVGQFAVSYSEGQLHFSPIYAGLLASLALTGSLVGSPLWGWIADRMEKGRPIILLGCIGAGLSIALIRFEKSACSMVRSLLCGFLLCGCICNRISRSSQDAQDRKEICAHLHRTDQCSGHTRWGSFHLSVPRYGPDFGYASILALARHFLGVARSSYLLSERTVQNPRRAYRGNHRGVALIGWLGSCSSS